MRISGQGDQGMIWGESLIYGLTEFRVDLKLEEYKLDLAIVEGGLVVQVS